MCQTNAVWHLQGARPLLQPASRLTMPRWAATPHAAPRRWCIDESWRHNRLPRRTLMPPPQILRHIARKHGLYGQTEAERARVDESRRPPAGCIPAGRPPGATPAMRMWGRRPRPWHVRASLRRS